MCCDLLIDPIASPESWATRVQQIHRHLNSRWLLSAIRTGSLISRHGGQLASSQMPRSIMIGRFNPRRRGSTPFLVWFVFRAIEDALRTLDPITSLSRPNKRSIPAFRAIHRRANRRPFIRHASKLSLPTLGKSTPASTDSSSTLNWNTPTYGVLWTRN